jgi:hypothetical protein
MIQVFRLFVISGTTFGSGWFFGKPRGGEVLDRSAFDDSRALERRFRGRTEEEIGEEIKEEVRRKLEGKFKLKASLEEVSSDEELEKWRLLMQNDPVLHSAKIQAFITQSEGEISQLGHQIQQLLHSIQVASLHSRCFKRERAGGCRSANLEPSG